MTTPTGNTPGAQALAQSGITLPSAGNSKSIYGLGNVSGQQVNVGGLLPIVDSSGKPVTPQIQGQTTDGTYTAEQVMAAFAHASPQTIAQIQHMLMLGGFYSSASYTPNYGVLNADDLTAMGKAVTTAAQTGADLNEYLARQAKFGEYTGVAAAMGQNKPREIKKADPLQLGSMIEKEFQDLTGRKATPAEKAGFIAAYNAAYTQAQQDAYNSADKAAGGGVDTAGYNTAPLPDVGMGGLNPSVAHDTSIDALNERQTAVQFSQEPQQPAQATTYTTQDFDPAAFAEEFVKQHAGAETGAHDIASQFSNFLSIVNGGIK